VNDENVIEIRQLPGELLSGASGDKAEFLVRFIGKTNNQDFPYTVANEIVGSIVGQAIGLNVQTVLPHSLNGQDAVLIQRSPRHAVMQQGPPATAAALAAYVENHADEIHGCIIFDLYIANNDRAVGPLRRNLLIDPDGRLLLIDNGNSCFYRHRQKDGIEAGIPRLVAVERDLRALFDMDYKKNVYRELLRDWTLVEKWCDRIRQIPPFLLEAAVDKIPHGSATEVERKALVDFLVRRRTCLLDQIKESKDAFPGLP
jgi:hypothetical protein